MTKKSLGWSPRSARRPHTAGWCRLFALRGLACELVMNSRPAWEPLSPPMLSCSACQRVQASVPLYLSEWPRCGLGPRGRTDLSSGLPEKIQTARKPISLIMHSMGALPCVRLRQTARLGDFSAPLPLRLNRLAGFQRTQVLQEAEWPTPCRRVSLHTLPIGQVSPCFRCGCLCHAHRLLRPLLLYCCEALKIPEASPPLCAGTSQMPLLTVMAEHTLADLSETRS